MTEVEWLACQDPDKMLSWLECAGPSDDGERDLQRWRNKPSDRKLRLFACACARQVWHLLTDERSRRAVEVAERYADGQASEEERRKASYHALRAPGGHEPIVAWACAADTGAGAATHAVNIVQRAAAQAHLLRDIVGNPFQPCLAEGLSTARYLYAFGGCGHCDHRGVVDDPSDLGSDGCSRSYMPCLLCCRMNADQDQAVALAEGTYQDRAFDRMPILADALEDAGCKDRGILGHCRGAEPHTRGCWVIDMLTGRG